MKETTDETWLVDLKLDTERVPCPLCGTKAGENFSEVSVTDGLWKLSDGFARLPELIYRYCDRHHLIWMAKRLTETTIRRLYTNGTRLRRTEPVADRPINQRRLSFVESTVETPVTSWADVGTNEGSLLLTAKNRGIEVMGLEPLEPLIDKLHSVDNTIPMYPESLETGTDELASFEPDLISLVHVLEHLPFPLKVLKTLRNLEPDHLLIEVPDASKGLFPRLFREHGHLYFYTVESLSCLLRHTGWTISVVEETKINNIRLLAHPGPKHETAEVDRGDTELESHFSGLTSRYQTLLNAEKQALQTWIRSWDDTDNVGIYGAGTDGYRWWKSGREHGLNIDCFLDQNAGETAFDTPETVSLHKPNQPVMRELDKLIISPLGKRQSIASNLNSQFNPCPDRYWVTPDGSIETAERIDE